MTGKRTDFWKLGPEVEDNDFNDGYLEDNTPVEIFPIDDDDEDDSDIPTGKRNEIKDDDDDDE